MGSESQVSVLSHCIVGTYDTNYAAGYIYSFCTLLCSIQIRRPIGTAFELILPALAVLAIVGLR